jgi:hypothetical protein
VKSPSQVDPEYIIALIPDPEKEEPELFQVQIPLVILTCLPLTSVVVRLVDVNLTLPFETITPWWLVVVPTLVKVKFLIV